MATETEERQQALRIVRSGALKIYRKFVLENGEEALKPGAGRGMEPRPWCGCHNRNPCPNTEELKEVN